MKIEPLPPLACLVAFEASVRHQSFTRAGQELHLSQSAVSRQVAQLEEFLGRSLFVREHKRLSLTVAGRSYADEIHRLLSHCAEATAAVMTHSSERELTLACSSGVACLWLAPLLGEYAQLQPEMDLRLRVVDSLYSLTHSEFDLAIYFLRGQPPQGLSGSLLFAEKVGAYCAPSYLNGLRLSPEALLEQRLLVLEDGQRQWLSWQEWFSQLGIAFTTPHHRLTMNHYPLLVQLAIDGHGVVMGWRPMIDRHLASGALVAACETEVHVAGGYQLLRPDDQLASGAARAFMRWLELRLGQA